MLGRRKIAPSCWVFPGLLTGVYKMAPDCPYAVSASDSVICAKNDKISELIIADKY